MLPSQLASSILRLLRSRSRFPFRSLDFLIKIPSPVYFEDQPGFLQWLSELKLLPGTEFVLSSVNAMAGTLSLTLEGDKEVLEISNSASRSLLVVKVN